MARAIWTGMLSFGLVNVPVGLYSATEDRTVHFNQFQSGTSDRIRNRRVNERTGDEVEFSQIVKGYDIGAGEYVMISNEELESVEPGPSRTIELTDFVDLDDIDPIYYKATYFLGPQGKDAQRAYGLLRTAMEASKKVGIATFVMRSKQHLVAIRPEKSVLALETMYFADEVRDPVKEIDGLQLDETFKGRELETAQLLVESMSAEWDPANYTDTYRERVEELIDRKRQGEVVVTDAASREPSPALDLMQALQKSVEAARSHRAGNRAPTPLVLSSAPTAPRRGPGLGDELGDLSKAELYERATQLEIPGRSKMSRVELQDAVRAATSPPARRRKAS
jgi:DNA end-binding protein Ku